MKTITNQEWIILKERVEECMELTMNDEKHGYSPRWQIYCHVLSIMEELERNEKSNLK